MIDIKPLTVIMGKNSCGKSSLIHSLLLLKQTMESNDKLSAVNLEGRFLKYSNLNELSYKIPRIQTASIGYEFKTTEETTIKIGIRNKKINDHYIPQVSEWRVNDIEGNEILDALKRKSIITMLSDNEFFERFLSKKTSLKIDFRNFIPETLILENFDDEENLSSRFSIPFTTFERIRPTINEFTSTIDNIKYLSPVRASPQRAYIHYTETSHDVNEDGFNAAHYFWVHKDRKVKWKGQEITLVEAANKCLACVGLTQKIQPVKSGKLIYQIKVSLDEKKSVTIADVGFGYSQVIPTILTGLTSNKDNLVLIEQPEIHLHPSSCANLADLFLGLIEDKRRFIIESHSQDFINRLQLRVIENPTLAEKINIIFIDKDDNGNPKANQFTIDKNGNFPDFPPGFLDESENGAVSILKARSESRRKNKSLIESEVQEENNNRRD